MMENLSFDRPEKKHESDVEFMIEPKPALLIGKGTIPQDILNDLNSLCDDLQTNPEGKDYSLNLVGEIQNGSQLEINTSDKRFKRFKKLLKDSATLYINHFFESIRRPAIPYHLKVDDVWSVHQYAGDYNPLHDHGSPYYSAFSGFIHLKVPSQIENKDFNSTNIYGAKGTLDGVTSIVWGNVGNREQTIFKYPATEYIIPTPGVYYIFPLWLNHCVYPFRGEGERRSIAYNIEVMWDDDYHDNPVPSGVRILR
jgi:hypothetical protein